MPYVYNSVPEITRVRGHRHRNFPTYREERRRLFRLAADAGFETIDFREIVAEEGQAVGSQFAPLALYVDHSHLSKLGIQRLLPRLTTALRR